MTFKLSHTVLSIGLATALMAATPAVAQAADCGTDRVIDIAEMSWPSAAALANIHAIILENGFGCNVEIVTGDTVPTTASLLAKGTPAIAPELWVGSVQDAWDAGVAAGDVEVAGVAISDGAIEGWWIPKYVADANPGLKRVEDLVDYAQLFADPDDPSKGRFYSCPPGWGCEISNAALFDAYGLKDSFNLFSPGSGGNLAASITRAFVRELPIVFYYWGPTAIMGKYDMVQLEMPPHDPEIWKCNMDAECGPNGKSEFPTPPVVVATAPWVSEEAPVVADYLSKVALNNIQISRMLDWGAENKASAEETAINFLETQEELWSTWVPAEAVAAIKASL